MIDQESSQGATHDGQSSDRCDDLIASATCLLLLDAALLLTLVLLAGDLAFTLVAARHAVLLPVPDDCTRSVTECREERGKIADWGAGRLSLMGDATSKKEHLEDRIVVITCL